MKNSHVRTDYATVHDIRTGRTLDPEDWERVEPPKRRGLRVNWLRVTGLVGGVLLAAIVLGMLS